MPDRNRDSKVSTAITDNGSRSCWSESKIGEWCWRAMLCVVCLWTVGVVAEVKAQTRVHDHSLSMGPWAFVPIVEDSTNNVTAFVALRDKTGVSGENILTVWFQRPTVSGQPWIARAWEDMDQWQGIKVASSELGFVINPSDWPVDISYDPSPAASQGDPYADGFFADDPLGSALVAANGRGWVIELLQESGYPVADIEFEKGEPWQPSPAQWLQAMADAVEASLATTPPDIEVAASVLSTKLAQLQVVGAQPATITWSSKWILNQECTDVQSGPDFSQGPGGGANNMNAGVCIYTITRTCCYRRMVSYSHPTLPPASFPNQTICVSQTREWRKTMPAAQIPINYGSFGNPCPPFGDPESPSTTTEDPYSEGPTSTSPLSPAFPPSGPGSPRPAKDPAGIPPVRW